MINQTKKNESLNIVALNREQRRRAMALEPLVAGDPTLAAHELIHLRDALKALSGGVVPATETPYRRIIRYSPAAAANIFDVYPEGTRFQRQGRDIIASLPTRETVKP